ncbi:MAG: FKBP-type peptidyl-prolyl cis-trans isomerase [Bacteroidales bacterium]|nr:FKBP-type peptidyl-prolyl cis-trans isomerase [Bacteroidales bacterium]MBN2755537.1 FKBP-type peptidyl-prolyl cis-trans isomerase [Bacteroidales bacterium]
MRIKNYFSVIALLLVVSIFNNACKKEDPAEIELEKLAAYIAENTITEEPTSSGMYYIETLEGTGVQAEASKTVKVDYTGKLIDGTTFDSSLERDPIEFTLGVGQVIAGWDEGITYMKVGGKATLIIPSDLAYGSREVGTIPAYSTLIFEVELIDVY